ncbi:MAG: helix-turn-helix transcriptional regulator [Ignavibacteriae bacterium]|nr:helix-turn-helix transcriptional regulator [Ignavibacteriota bacterium]
MKKKKKMKKDENCPIRNILDRFGDKWSLLILVRLSDDYTLSDNYKMRFNELHKSIDGISQKMLTVSLRTLEADGLVQRKIFPEVPPRVEYRLSDMGKSLIPLIADLAKWAYENQFQILYSRKKYNGKKISLS